MRLVEYIDSLTQAKGAYKRAVEASEQAKADCEEAFKPLRPFPAPDEVRRVYDICLKHKGSYSVAYTFVCVCLLLYSPSSLFGDEMKIRLAMEIACVLGVKHNNIYFIRRRVSAWLSLYRDFYAEVDGIFNEVLASL